MKSAAVILSFVQLAFGLSCVCSTMGLANPKLSSLACLSYLKENFSSRAFMSNGLCTEPSGGIDEAAFKAACTDMNFSLDKSFKDSDIGINCV
ncbi:hypothetical protein E4U42_003358 [Claviceps africana]|uniref:Secreted protein n=1 Tax=Claviceps africana TaxID=83212 RepID=A0A8K0NLM2_9HYPO|nr:hypothetical protein E4U42_003358 [Claviceps africana]